MGEPGEGGSGAVARGERFGQGGPVTQSRTEPIQAADGGELSGHLVVPGGGSGPGLLILQEIFGLSPYVKAVCERVAELGYVALAPDLFWRLEPGA